MGRPGLTSHRKFRRLARALDAIQPGLGTLLARGALELIWEGAYEAGDPFLGDQTDIEDRAQWNGPNGALRSALQDAGGEGKPGFIEEGGTPFWPEGRTGTYRVHDLFDHAPQYVTNRRERESERKETKTCARCRSEFKSPDAKAKFCSGACRTAAWRDARGDGANARERTVTNGDDTPAPAPTPTPKKGEADPPRDAQRAAPETAPPASPAAPDQPSRHDPLGLEHLRVKLGKAAFDPQWVRFLGKVREVDREQRDAAVEEFFRRGHGKDGTGLDYLAVMIREGAKRPRAQAPPPEERGRIVPSHDETQRRIAAERKAAEQADAERAANGGKIPARVAEALSKAGLT